MSLKMCVFHFHMSKFNVKDLLVCIKRLDGIIHSPEFPADHRYKQKFTIVFSSFIQSMLLT